MSTFSKFKLYTESELKELFLSFYFRALLSDLQDLYSKAKIFGPK